MKNKLIIITLGLLLACGIIGTFWGPAIVEAATIWNSCDRGQVNCAYPGECHSYTDTNGDNICDRSQSAPVTTTTTTTAASIITDTTGTVSVPAVSVDNSTQTTVTAAAVITSTTSSDNTATTGRSSYNLLPVLLITAVLYSATWLCSSKKAITVLLHRKIWNVVLLVAALISTILGILLIAELDFNLNITLPFNMLFWHVETGIVLGTVAFFHIFWHWKYFTKMLKLSRQ